MIRSVVVSIVELLKLRLVRITKRLSFERRSS